MRQQIAAVLLIILATACYRKVESSAELTSTGPSTSTASGNSATDTTSTIAASATTTAASGGTVSIMTEREKTFLMDAAQASMAEVILGQMAAEKGTSPAVKSFGQRMMTDHRKSRDELIQFAVAKGLALPTELDETQKRSSEDLATKSGTDFDSAYIATMIQEHRKVVSDFQAMAAEAKDADLQRWVNTHLPILQEHLRMAEGIQKTLR
ncbi:MAG TPA: DUF4142 domain-containing protein [Thermoanaerobaculia bacterium]|nr:DUF4142 domain-containing protein [Thermoanaerobaculia bacterium]